MHERQKAECPPAENWLEHAMLRSWFECLDIGPAITAGLTGSVIELDPIGEMIGALRSVVDPCARDLVPQIRTDKAVIQPHTMAGRAVRRIGHPAF